MLRKVLYPLFVSILLFSVGCAPAPAPTVSEISASPNTNIEAGAQIALYITAVGSNLVYQWSATDGAFAGPSTNPSVIFVAPKTSGVVTISIEVKDSTGTTITKSITLTIQAPPAPTATETLPPEPTNTPLPTPIPPYVVFDTSGKLAIGLDMGVNTSGGLTNWVDISRGEMCMSYPGGQWGAVFITVGKPIPLGNRPGKDFSAYKTLSLDLKGAKGNEYVLVGLKDRDDSDDGTEITLPITLTANYQTYTFPLSKFATADLSKIYVSTEFVFEKTPEKICVNNIQFLP